MHLYSIGLISKWKIIYKNMCSMKSVVLHFIGTEISCQIFKCHDLLTLHYMSYFMSFQKCKQCYIHYHTSKNKLFMTQIANTLPLL